MASLVALTISPSASALRSTRLAVSSIPASSAKSRRAWANGDRAPTRATIRRSPGESEALATPSSVSLGARPPPQLGQWYQARRTVTGPSTVSRRLPR